MKSKFLVSLLIIGMSMFMISTVNAQDTDEEGDEQQLCAKRYGDTPEDSVTCVTNLSLYREFYKQWKKSGYKNTMIKDAIKPWRWVFLNCPCGSQNIYIDGSNILEHLIESAESDEEKNAYVDTLMMLYDQRIQYFDKEGYVLGLKGLDLYKYRTSDYEQAYEIFDRSVELQGNKTLGPILVYYFRTVTKMASTGKIDSAVVVETYEEVSNIIDYNLENTSSDKKKASWENIKGNIDQTFEPYASCENLIAIYDKKYQESPEDIELLKKITTTLDKNKCTDSELYFNASVGLYDQEPSPQAAYLIGKMYINEKDYNKAIQYLQEATEMEDKETLAKIYYYMSFSYQMLGNKSQARSMAYKALEAQPNRGDVYILIGDLYASSANDCANNDLMKKAVYWAAVDKYYKAKSVDPEVTDIANERIGQYSQYFPSKETIFFHDYNEGDSFTVECWINETTKVRSVN